MSISATLVRETTATTGSGTIDLGGAVPGFVTFSSAYVTGDITQYRIEEAGDIEEGLGTLTTGTPWTLARTTIYQKITSGVLAQWPASGLSLSGNAEVTVGPSVFNTVAPVYPALSAGLYDIPDNLTTAYGETTPSVSIASGTIYAASGLLLVPRKLTTLAIEVLTNSVLTTALGAAVYDSDSTGRPGKLLGGVSFASPGTTGTKVATLSSALYLNPGYYWFCMFGIWTTIGPIITRWGHNKMAQRFGTAATNTLSYGVTKTGQTSFPAAFGTISGAAALLPVVLWRP